MRSLVNHPRVWLGILFFAHFLLALYYFPPLEFFDNAPFHTADHTSHFYDAYAVSQVLTQSGHTWGYDPNFMAGYPVGTAFDVDNEMTELFVWAFAFLSAPFAYNLFVLIIYLALPFVVLMTARNFRLSRWAQVFAVALGVMIYQGDPSAHTMPYVGMIAFSGVTFLAPWVVSLFYVYLRRGGRRNWSALAGAATFIVLLHILSLVVLVLPVLVLYVFYLPRLGWKRQLALWGIVLLVLVVGLYWLLPVLQFQQTITDTGQYFGGGVNVLWNDLIGVGLTDGTPYARFLFLRWLLAVLSAGGILLWMRAANRELAVTFASVLVGLFLLAYFAIYVPGGSTIEPYRFVVPTLFFAVVPAAHALGDSSWRNVLAEVRPVQRWVLAVLLLLPLFDLLGALYQTHPRIERYWDNSVTEDRFVGVGPRQRALFDWLRKNTATDSRILIQDWATGALIPYFVGRQVIGGPYYPFFLQHNIANVGGDIAFEQRIADLAPADLLAYLRAYNVHWIVVNQNAFAPGVYHFGTYVQRRHPDFIQPMATIGGFAIYRVDSEPNFFLTGEGQVQASFNTLRVENASSGGVVLKYHWMDGLKSEPPLPLARVAVLDDPIGFIRVENGNVHDFTIYNGY